MKMGKLSKSIAWWTLTFIYTYITVGVSYSPTKQWFKVGSSALNYLTVTVCSSYLQIFNKHSLKSLKPPVNPTTPPKTHQLISLKSNVHRTIKVIYYASWPHLLPSNPSVKLPTSIPDQPTYPVPLNLLTSGDCWSPTYLPTSPESTVNLLSSNLPLPTQMSAN